MAHPRIVDVVRRAVAVAQCASPPLMDRAEAVPVSQYTDAARLGRERARLFRTVPIPVAHASELSSREQSSREQSHSHTALVRELDGVSLILTRGEDGVVRGFRNSCRHRGVRLIREDCRAKALVCPYHGWTYGTDGALIHIPHKQAFPSCDPSERGLVPARVEERHGIIWASLDDGAADVRAHLGEIDDEISSLELGTHVVGERLVREQRGNWKMLIEAFLEGYHLRPLHRDSIYPFFLDARSVAEQSGGHVRSATARRTAKEVRVDELGSDMARLGEIATVSYLIFPCTTLILHPDWTSLITVMPLATDRFVWSHTQLIPEAPLTEEARSHFARSFALIEGQVFEKEDLRMCAEMQAGLETGANETLLIGLLETPVLWFHDAIRERLGSDG